MSPISADYEPTAAAAAADYRRRDADPAMIENKQQRPQAWPRLESIGRPPGGCFFMTMPSVGGCLAFIISFLLATAAARRHFSIPNQKKTMRRPKSARFTEFYRVSRRFGHRFGHWTGLDWVLPSFTGFYWVLPSFTGFYLVLLGFTGFYWVSPCFTGFYLVLLGWPRMTSPSPAFSVYRVLPGFTSTWASIWDWTGLDWVLPSFTGLAQGLLGCLLDHVGFH